MHRTHSAFLDRLTIFTFLDEEYHMKKIHTIIAEIMLDGMAEANPQRHAYQL